MIESIIGSGLLLLMFFLAGINKISNFNSTVSSFKSKFFMKNLPNIFYTLIIVSVIILEIVAPSIIMLEFLNFGELQMYSFYSSIGLAIFTILATLIYHPPTNPKERISFMKNTSIIGGLILLSTFFQ